MFVHEFLQSSCTSEGASLSPSMTTSTIFSIANAIFIACCCVLVFGSSWIVFAFLELVLIVNGLIVHCVACTWLVTPHDDPLAIWVYVYIFVVH